MSKPLLIGITGGIGSGKSIVCKIFNHLGVKSYDSDSRAKAIMQDDLELINQLKLTFGEHIYNDKILNRELLGSIVFNDSQKLAQLNALVHPAVAQDFNNWVLENSNEIILLKEAALLVETNSYKDLDHLIVVTAPKPIRIQRVLKRDPHRKLDELEKVMSNQFDDSEKIDVANFVITNDEKQLLIPQVIEVLEKLKNC